MPAHLCPVKKMLANMFIGSPKGNYDRLLDFSTAKTGTLFFVPTLDMLDDFYPPDCIRFTYRFGRMLLFTIFIRFRLSI